MWSVQSRSSLQSRQIDFFNLATDELLKRQRVLWCSFLCAFLNLSDMMLSLHLFSQFRGLEEGNPLMRAVLAMSDGHFVALKMSLGNVCIVALYVFARKGHKLAERGLYFVTAVLCLVVIFSLVGLYLFSHASMTSPTWHPH